MTIKEFDNEDKIFSKHIKNLKNELKELKPDISFKVLVYGEDKQKPIIEYWY